jgi:hypothetical protein
MSVSHTYTGGGTFVASLNYSGPWCHSITYDINDPSSFLHLNGCLVATTSVSVTAPPAAPKSYDVTVNCTTHALAGQKLVVGMTDGSVQQFDAGSGEGHASSFSFNAATPPSTLRAYHDGAASSNRVTTPSATSLHLISEDGGDSDWNDLVCDVSWQGSQAAPAAAPSNNSSGFFPTLGNWLNNNAGYTGGESGGGSDNGGADGGSSDNGGGDNGSAGDASGGEGMG